MDTGEALQQFDAPEYLLAFPAPQPINARLKYLKCFAFSPDVWYKKLPCSTLNSFGKILKPSKAAWPPRTPRLIHGRFYVWINNTASWSPPWKICAAGRTRPTTRSRSEERRVGKECRSRW